MCKNHTFGSKLTLALGSSFYYTTIREDNQQYCLFYLEVLHMRAIYIVTGAAGHLGGTIVRLLSRAGVEVRALTLPGERQRVLRGVRWFCGDVCSPESLRPLFAGLEDREVYVIHAAGVVDISGELTQRMQTVNVEGTKNILRLCREFAVKRLVYVSSVHALPEREDMGVMREVRSFSPDWVTGGYAKTKAEATQAVLDAAADGLDAVVVHPSGILGPYDDAGNHLVQMLRDYLRGKLPACVRGGYDLVDVRDVASGCIRAAIHGRAGECYILSNRHYEVCDVLKLARETGGGRRLPVLPMWMARAAAPLLGWVARLCRRRPLYTRYSLYALASNDRFDHDKATAELNYRPRDLRTTVRDTVRYLKSHEEPRRHISAATRLRSLLRLPRRSTC